MVLALLLTPHGNCGWNLYRLPTLPQAEGWRKYDTTPWEGCNLYLDLDDAQALAAMGLPDNGSDGSEAFLDARRGEIHRLKREFPRSTIDQFPLHVLDLNCLSKVITYMGRLYYRRASRWGLAPDIQVALSQTCTSIHAWYFTAHGRYPRVHGNAAGVDTPIGTATPAAALPLEDPLLARLDDDKL